MARSRGTLLLRSASAQQLGLRVGHYSWGAVLGGSCRVRNPRTQRRGPDVTLREEENPSMQLDLKRPCLTLPGAWAPRGSRERSPSAAKGWRGGAAARPLELMPRILRHRQDQRLQRGVDIMHSRTLKEARWRRTRRILSRSAGRCVARKLLITLQSRGGAPALALAEGRDAAACATNPTRCSDEVGPGNAFLDHFSENRAGCVVMSERSSAKNLWNSGSTPPNRARSAAIGGHKYPLKHTAPV